LRPRFCRLLPVESYIRYARVMHIETPAIEKWKLGHCPKSNASEFGWEEMVASVGVSLQQLPADVRPRTAISPRTSARPAPFDLFGGRYGLPQKPSAVTRTIFCGDRAITPAKA